MKIIEQQAELFAASALFSKSADKRAIFNPTLLLETCGRIAYQSQQKMTDVSGERFIDSLKSRKHESVFEHLVCTIIGTTNRGVSHELVRHRIASYTQQSTRYVDEQNMTVISPSWLGKYADRPEIFSAWENIQLSAERSYRILREMGCTKQEARGALPNDLATEIAITMNAREWRHFITLRTAQDAHPDMILFASLCQDVLAEFYPFLFAKGATL